MLEPDPTQTLSVVLLTDPNLHPDMDLVAYARSRHESLILDVSATIRATRFVLHPIPLRYVLEIDSAHRSQESRWRESTSASLRAIVHADGKTEEPPRLQRFRQAHGEEWSAVSDEWMLTVYHRWGVDAVYTLGRIAYDLARRPRRSSPLGSGSG